MEAAAIKAMLYQHCLEYVEARINTAQQAMASAQQAANEEGKSSAGDKYETSRAMMQIERDQAAQQLAEALKLRSMLDSIPRRESKVVSQGSLVISSGMNVYIAISAGTFRINGVDFITIGSTAPLAKNLLGLGRGDSFLFKGEKVTIEDVV